MEVHSMIEETNAEVIAAAIERGLGDIARSTRIKEEVSKLPVHPAAERFPLMSEAEARALGEDMAEHGMVYPITLMPLPSGGSCLNDGRNRLRAAELVPGVELKLEAFEGTEEEAIAQIWSKNMQTRHLTDSQRALIAADWASLPPGRPKTATGDPFTLDKAVKQFGISKTYIKYARELKKLDPGTADRIQRGESSGNVKKAVMDAKARERLLGEAEACKSAGVKLPEHALHFCTCAELIQHVEPGSVDVIITDPPYAREYLPCWSELAEFAATALKPGGLLVAISGQAHLPEVIERLGERLSYWWECNYATPGTVGENIARRVSISRKPVLVYVNGGSYRGRPFGDNIVSPAAEKLQSGLLHTGGSERNWGQTEGGTRELVLRFSEPDDLVCDPFLGSGTTAAIALRSGRRFLGCDLDPECIEVTRKRLRL
jgi:hypothetical protein